MSYPYSDADFDAATLQREANAEAREDARDDGPLMSHARYAAQIAAVTPEDFGPVLAALDRIELSDF